MEVKEYIDKIVNNQDTESMEKLGDLFEEALSTVKKYSRNKYKNMEMCLYELAYGKILTKEIAEDWVENMDPPSKWDFETTSTVKKQHNITDIDDISFYVVMNMLYSDMSNVLGAGDTAESLNMYIQATKDWLNDGDITDCKLYNYWRYVAQDND